MLSRKQLLKKTRSLNEKAGREKARRKQALQQKQGAVRSRLAVAGASSRAALRGELAALESSLEGETVAKLMAQLGAAKEERRTRRRATYLAKVANSDQRVPTVNPRVSHSKPWLSAMNSRNCIPMRKGYGLGPSTSSKPFGLVGKSLWPVQPARHARSLPKEAWRAFPDGRPFLEPPPREHEPAGAALDSAKEHCAAREDAERGDGAHCRQPSAATYPLEIRP